MIKKTIITLKKIMINKIIMLISYSIEIFTKITYNYYKSFNKISLFNWWQVQSGDLTYLYRWIRFKKFPLYFLNVYRNMVYQMDVTDNNMLRMQAKEARFRYLHVSTGDPKWLNRANSQQVSIGSRKTISHNEMKLNDFVDIIEIAFNDISKIDPYKISAGRAYSLYYKALKKTQNANN